MGGSRRLIRELALAAAVMSLAACASSTPKGPALPQSGYYKIGKPYQVKGVWYYPKEDYGYDETGIASWYGPGFHQERTANGEIFDQDELTAAHKTLPMPSLVRVTNLDNGRSLVVRINDRGPFYPGRIIDLSRRSAQLLGVVEKGTAKVRVTVLPEESKAIAAAAKAGQPTSAIAVASVTGVDGDPAPRAAPRMSVEVDGAPVKAKPVKAEQPSVVEAVATVPGVVKEGRFLPSAQVAQLKASDGQSIYIQVGAFARQTNAQAVKSKLAGIATATITPKRTADGDVVNRVRLGPFASVDQADAMLNKVIASGIVDDPKVIVE
ncbi:MAG TPA: septal ring lytic transglycosylase RlpA family protein [Azospirillaceae bacterium]|nr:septal ring lytic transglycosylase RlpA family protein [Azospirillaceae bacterium]